VNLAAREADLDLFADAGPIAFAPCAIVRLSGDEMVEGGIMQSRQFTREEIFRLVWSTPLETLAAEFGISGRGLAKSANVSQSFLRRADTGKGTSVKTPNYPLFLRESRPPWTLIRPYASPNVPSGQSVGRRGGRVGIQRSGPREATMAAGDNPEMNYRDR
jgi:hypothetical protein